MSASSTWFETLDLMIGLFTPDSLKATYAWITAAIDESLVFYFEPRALSHDFMIFESFKASKSETWEGQTFHSFGRWDSDFIAESWG